MTTLASRPRRRRVLLGLLATVLAAGVAAAPASAGPTGDYANFTDCPLSNPNATTCLYSATTSGQFTLGNGTVPISRTIVLQGGYSLDPETGAAVFYPAAGGRTLSRTPLEVPGGLLGLMDFSGFGGWLLQWFWDIVNTANDVTATAELVRPVGFSFVNYVTGNGPAITLPVRIKLDNPFLGDECYLGSAGDPMIMRLTTGTTRPPGPNRSITGSPGQVSFLNDGDLITGVGYRLVDNAFAAPGASGCGPFGFRWLVNAAVDLKQGVPAAAGRNAAILGGSMKIGSADAVRASVR